MATLVVKSFLEMPDLSVETRRFGVERGNMDKNGIFEIVNGTIGRVFPDLKNKKFSLFWKDLDDDFVIMSTDEEMRDALSNETNGICKIYVRVSVNEDEINEQSEGEQNSSDGKQKGNHQRCDPWQDLSPPFAPHPGCFPHPPHPHHSFGHHGPFSKGPFGGPWGKWGKGKRLGRSFDHPHHPFEHYWGHHHHGHGGHFSHGRHGKHHGHHGHHGHDGKYGGKDSLMNLVPMPHRRWAKYFIQCWRNTNLMNATSTSDSGDNSDGKMIMTNAGVPQAYADWLEMKLERWHMKWCSDEMNGERPRIKEEKKMKKALKGSVPVEFRKWTKWFLNSHFGRRESPRFRCDSPGNRKGGCRKDPAMKKSFVNAQVPEGQRAWTKQFIRDWRIEKKLDEPNSAIPPSSDNEGPTDVDMESTKEMSVPEAYKQWLEIFLPRWHSWRGQLERSSGHSMTGGMNQFQTTVPMEFRAWVKFYLNRNYSKYNNSKVLPTDDVMKGKYQKILKTFKKRWLQDQKLLEEEGDTQTSSSSSDEEYLVIDDKEPEASFSRLNLNKDDATKKTHVSFQETIDVPMNYDFRQWTKQALAEWDAETVNDDRQQEEDVSIPPHIQQWMSKMMMKMQMKNMKQQFKAAKREMKSAKKQFK